jgi:Uma2 family endonuclease
VKTRALGKVLVEVGYVLVRAPDTVRAPDISFVAASRLAGGRAPQGFISGPPDLAVEVVSPGDSATDLDAKVQEYLLAGTRLLWLVHPGTRTVTAYRPDGTARVLREGDMLDAEGVIPDFRVPVQDLFPV